MFLYIIYVLNLAESSTRIEIFKPDNCADTYSLKSFLFV